MNETVFSLQSEHQPTGDQPEAIAQLVGNIEAGVPAQVLLGVTGSGKTFTMANVIARCNRPALVLAPNKTLAAQLYSEFRALFPRNAVALSETQLALPEEHTPSPLPPAALQLIERQTTALEGILLVLQGLVQRMADHMDESKEDTSALRKDIDTLRTLLDASEKTQQADIEQLRQWMGRVIQNRQRQIAAM